MFKIGDYITTIEKKPYPWSGQIRNIETKNGITYYKCWMTDQSSEVIRKIYTKSDIRHYSAKEMAYDIFSHYSGEEKPVIENIYSKEYMDWLLAEIKRCTDGIAEIENAERTIVDPDFGNYTSAELAELEYMSEYSGCLMELHDIIQHELSEMHAANEEAWLITINNSNVTGLEMYQFSGTKKDVQKQIRNFAKKIQESDKEHYDGASKVEENNENELMMVVYFTDCHVEIGARRINSIPELEEE